MSPRASDNVCMRPVPRIGPYTVQSAPPSLWVLNRFELTITRSQLFCVPVALLVRTQDVITGPEAAAVQLYDPVSRDVSDTVKSLNRSGLSLAQAIRFGRFDTCLA